MSPSTSIGFCGAVGTDPRLKFGFTPVGPSTVIGPVYDAVVVVGDAVVVVVVVGVLFLKFSNSVNKSFDICTDMFVISVITSLLKVAALSDVTVIDALDLRLSTKLSRWLLVRTPKMIATNKMISRRVIKTLLTERKLR